MEREKWLNGWKRQGDIIFMGPGAHCVGCGRALGVTNVVIQDGNWNPPKKAPDWPFPENDCPICSKEYREITVDDVAKLPLSMIRQALAIKKSAQQMETVEQKLSRIESFLHSKMMHPDFEYETTNGPRKTFDKHPPGGNGWERNIHIGDAGWERFDYYESSYWMRLREQN